MFCAGGAISSKKVVKVLSSPHQIKRYGIIVA
jgi:hypothetical protein